MREALASVRTRVHSASTAHVVLFTRNCACVELHTNSYFPPAVYTLMQANEYGVFTIDTSFGMIEDDVEIARGSGTPMNLGSGAVCNSWA